MLCITLLPGGYFTVGDDVVIQYDRLSGERIHLTVNAPRQVPVLRGEVLERQGGQRPDCLLPVPEQSRRYKWFRWDQEKEDTVRAL